MSILTPKSHIVLGRILACKDWKIHTGLLKILCSPARCLNYCNIWCNAFILQSLVCFIIMGIKFCEYHNNRYYNNCRSGVQSPIMQDIFLPFPVPTLEKKSSSALVTGLELSIGMQYLGTDIKT
jgi:hypothetical protein